MEGLPRNGNIPQPLRDPVNPDDPSKLGCTQGMCQSPLLPYKKANPRSWMSQPVNFQGTYPWDGQPIQVDACTYAYKSVDEPPCFFLHVLVSIVLGAAWNVFQ